MNDSAYPAISVVVPTCNPGDQEILVINRLVSELDSYGNYFELIIVNDSSEPLLKEYKDSATRFDHVQIVENRKNYGRAYSRNRGASASTAPVLWFLDSDCIVSGDTVNLAAGLNRDEWDVYFGAVENCSDRSFWSQYQQRRRDAKPFITTANLLIRKSLFDQIGGFDESYTRYGFEDRDLVERFPPEARIQHNKDLTVEHYGEMSLAITRRKIESAADSGRRFASKFPKAYAEMEYAKVDAVIVKPVIYAVLSLLEVVERVIFPVSEFLVDRSVVPFALKKNIVRFTFAGAYFRGTRSVARETSGQG